MAIQIILQMSFGSREYWMCFLNQSNRIIFEVKVFLIFKRLSMNLNIKTRLKFTCIYSIRWKLINKKQETGK